MNEHGGVAQVDFTDLLRPPQTLREFVTRITSGLRTGETRTLSDQSERRAQQRHRLPLRVEVQPIDSDLTPVGDVYSVIAHDISAIGIGIRDTREVTTKFLALQMTGPSGEQMQVLGEVVRCQNVDRIYEIAAQFVSYGAINV